MKLALITIALSFAAQAEPITYKHWVNNTSRPQPDRAEACVKGCYMITRQELVDALLLAARNGARRAVENPDLCRR